MLLVVVSVNLIQDSIRSPKVIRSKEACCRLPRETESFAKADVSFTILIVDCTIWNVSWPYCMAGGSDRPGKGSRRARVQFLRIVGTFLYLRYYTQYRLSYILKQL